MSARLPDRTPRAIVFDMDGLMLDTERLDRRLWQEAARVRGLAFPDALHDTLIGRRARDSEQSLREHFGPDFPLEAIKAEVHAQWLLQAAAGMPCKPGLEALLDRLDAAALPRAVATSTARARALLSLGELAPRFDSLSCGDEVVHGKPAPDIFLLAAQRLDIAPEHCLVLEDSPAGLAAARAAGMTVILIPDLVRPSQPAEYECASLDDVRLWLDARLADRGA